MPRHNTLLLLVLISLLPLLTIAQPGGKTAQMGNEDVDIVKEYQPVLNDAFKIDLQPEDNVDTKSTGAPLIYKLNPAPAPASFNTSPIKPVRIKDDAIKKLYHGWLKAGYGLENMPLVDAAFNSLRSKRFDAGAHLYHLSAGGKIKDYGFPGNSTTNFTTFGNRYFEKFKLGASLGYRFDKVHYYGFKSPPELYSKSETKHTLQDINGKIDFESLGKEKEKWSYRGGVEFYGFNNNRDFNENNIRISAGLSKWMNNAYFHVCASGEFGNIEQPTFSFGRNIIRFEPKFSIEQGMMKVDIGARMAIESNNGESDYRLYPVLEADFRLIEDAVRIFGGISGDLQRNDLRSFARENPFFGNFVPMVNTNRKLVAKAGTSIRLEHDLMLSAQASWQRARNLPFFFNEYRSDFPTTFGVVYDTGTQLQFKASLEYKKTEKSSLSLTTEYNRYDLDVLEKAFYAPRLRTGLNGHYTIGEKILIKADLFYNNGVYGYGYTLQNDTITPVKGEVVELKGWIDLNLSIDYRYSKTLSAWVSLNNLGFSRYFRWYEYPSYRMLGLAGITYSF